jgi:hypothetical protein
MAGASSPSCILCRVFSPGVMVKTPSASVYSPFWKPACTHSAHRREIFHSRSRTKVTTLPATGSGATCIHVSTKLCKAWMTAFASAALSGSCEPNIRACRLCQFSICAACGFMVYVAANIICRSGRREIDASMFWRLTRQPSAIPSPLRNPNRNQRWTARTDAPERAAISDNSQTQSPRTRSAASPMLMVRERRRLRQHSTLSWAENHLIPQSHL